MFDEFWKLCRRKESKGTARKAYAKALKLSSHGDIMRGMERSVEHWEKESTLKQYIPLPATWLNGERWEDEYEESNVVDIFERAKNERG